MSAQSLRIITTRLQSLETNVRKIQKLIRRKQLAGFEHKDVYFRIQSVEPSGNIYDDIKLKSDENRKSFSEQGKKVNAFEWTVPESLSIYIEKFKQNLRYNTLWILVHVLAVCASCYYIKTAFDNWQSSPVVQATSNKQVHFTNISFPAITICWPFHFNGEYDFYANVENCFDCKNNLCTPKNQTCDYSEIMTFLFAYQMCSKYSQATQLSTNMYEAYPIIKNLTQNDEFAFYMNKLIPSCETDTVITRKVYGTEPFRNFSRCDTSVYQQFLSGSNRICMTFNSLRHEDIYKAEVVTPMPWSNTVASGGTLWSFDNMMDFVGGLNSNPIYGLNEYAILLTKPEDKNEIRCGLSNKDLVSIVVHNPNEIPYNEIMKANEVNVEIGSGVEIYVSPKITLARDLDQYSPQQRGCYFSSEKKLMMFQQYTKNNCDLECLVNTYLQECDCVPFSYPRPNSSVKICVLPCPKVLYRCECLPECNSLSYEVTSQNNDITDLVVKNISVLGYIEIRLKSNKFYTNVRYSINSNKEFLAYTLGVLGAFLGFSVTCVWQLVYFGIARLWRCARTPGRNAVHPFLQNND